MKIIIGADHRGVGMREYLATAVKQCLPDLEEVITVGATAPDQSIHYPYVVESVAQRVLQRTVNFGVLLCGSGNGVAIAANKYDDTILAAVCRTAKEAEMARLHNNANILCIGTDFTGEAEILHIIKAFSETEFEGGRHQERLDLIHELSNPR